MRAIFPRGMMLFGAHVVRVPSTPVKNARAGVIFVPGDRPWKPRRQASVSPESEKNMASSVASSWESPRRCNLHTFGTPSALLSGPWSYSRNKWAGLVEDVSARRRDAITRPVRNLRKNCCSSATRRTKNR